jgi:cell division protein FtsX
LRRAATAGAIAAVALTGCGGSKPREVAAAVAPPRGCFVQVFFASRMVTGRMATRGEIRAVRDRIASNATVKTYAFVSRGLALRRMARKYPAIAGNLRTNPLPDAFEVVPRSAKDAPEVAADLRDLRGVEHVGVARACKQKDS